jgi:hypothetical protein
MSSASDRATFQREDNATLYAVYFETDQGILKEDRIVIGSNYYLVLAYSGSRTPANPTGNVGVYKAVVQTLNQTVNP